MANTDTTLSNNKPKSRRNRLYVGLICFIISVFSVIITVFVADTQRRSREQSLASEILNYQRSAMAVEKKVIQGLPIYEDYISQDKEAELRRYLLPDHLAAATGMRLTAVSTDSDMEAHINSGRLVAVPSGSSAPFFYYNVPEKYRVLRPVAAKGLYSLSEEFRARLNAKQVLPIVKFAISSATRPVDYQNQLKSRNANASFISSHSYGISVDIFYDEYFVAFPEPEKNGSVQTQILEETRKNLGYAIGASLRRQFRAAMAETLSQAQKRGKLFAILEQNQRCYHVTFLE